MAEIITDGSQKELKKHGSDEFPLLVSYEQLSGYKSGSFFMALASGNRDHTCLRRSDSL